MGKSHEYLNENLLLFFGKMYDTIVKNKFQVFFQTINRIQRGIFMYFDTHAHYDDEQFETDREQVFDLIHESGVELVMNPACDIVSGKAAVSYADKYSWVYAAVGIHPQSVLEMMPGDIEEVKKMSSHPKVRAIGEIGLDYHYGADTKKEQIELFYEQMRLADMLDLPVIVHDREAHADCIDAVRAFPNVRGVFHCYSGSLETAKELIRRGWYISFTGALTFKNARRAAEVAKWLPDDRIMVETDCPYMAPVPLRGKRCDSSMLQYTVGVLAEIRGISPGKAAELTLKNGINFFDIDL